jgi:hypothetical protein
MSHSQWHRFYASKVAAPQELLFGLLSDLPYYDRWLPSSEQFGGTADVKPYPVQLGSRYHDGRPGVAGKDCWGTVTGLQRPGSIDFHHTIAVRQLRAAVDVRIHYSLEPAETGTVVSRWLVLDINMPAVLRPPRSAITVRFDKENLRTLAGVKQYAETHIGDGVPSQAGSPLSRPPSSPSSQPGASPSSQPGS